MGGVDIIGLDSTEVAASLALQGWSKKQRKRLYRDFLTIAEEAIPILNARSD